MPPAMYGAGLPSARLDAAGVLAHVAALHSRPEDLSEGDLAHRIYRYRVYERQHIPLGILRLTEFFVDDDLVARYAALAGDLPPIVFDPLAGSIIDGIHRANAASQRGAATIDAWVGIPGELDPDWSEEDDPDED